MIRQDQQEARSLSLVRSLWRTLIAPNSRFSLGFLLLAGLFAGVVATVGFEWTMHATNTDAFCVSCHELSENALVEFVGTSHHTNKGGVVAGCPDCHVPKEFVPKMARKLRAVGEVYHHILGTIDTPEKYDEHRMWMATRTWDYMTQRDSQECRNCHEEASWDLSQQSEKAREYHAEALENGKTCISCHKGLAHKLPKGIRKDDPIKGVDF